MNMLATGSLKVNQGVYQKFGPIPSILSKKAWQPKHQGLAVSQDSKMRETPWVPQRLSREVRT